MPTDPVRPDIDDSEVDEDELDPLDPTVGDDNDLEGD